MNSLVELYNSSEVKSITKFCDTMKKLDIADICTGYRDLHKAAPKRSKRGKNYFPEGYRTGTTSTGESSNRREEHLAIALYNFSRKGNALTLPDQRSLKIVDYQTPLKAKQADKGIGKLDLFAIIDGDLPAVVELKVKGQNNSLSDTPLRAYLEGLAYCAIVEANISVIAKEAESELEHSLKAEKTILIVMAPEEYWRPYLLHTRAGSWLPELARISESVKRELQIETHFVSLKDVKFDLGLAGKPPLLRNIGDLMTLEQVAEYLI